MRKIINNIVLIILLTAIGCGDKKNKENEESNSVEKTEEVNVVVSGIENVGIGPVKSISLAEVIDQKLAGEGKELFESKCTACHKIEKRYIGPSPKGILEHRSPEWVMNMILNPEQMTKEDPDAKQLLIEYNGTPMANQNLTEDEARAVLEYFRTL